MHRNQDAHERTRGVHATNDPVENKFASGDYVMRTYRGISVLNASGIVQQRAAHDFDRELNIVSDRRKRKRDAEEQDEQRGDGFFWATLTSELRSSLVTMSRREAVDARRVNREEKEQHDAEKLARREEALQRQLVNAVDKYAEALELFDQWKAQGVQDKRALDRALDGLSVNEKLAELRRQIEMRTVGCGWSQFQTQWSFNPDEKESTVKQWTTLLLNDILPYERVQKREKQLPKEAVPPQVSRP